MRLKYLRTKPRKVVEASPCIAEMGAMIQCWTASGVDDAKCMQTAKMLADCMKNLVCSQKASFYRGNWVLDERDWQLRPKDLFRNRTGWIRSVHSQALDQGDCNVRVELSTKIDYGTIIQEDFSIGVRDMKAKGNWVALGC